MGRPRFLALAADGKIDLDMACRNKFGRRQRQHSPGAYIERGEQLPEGLSLVIGATHEKRKRKRKAVVLATLLVRSERHHCIVLPPGYPG